MSQSTEKEKPSAQARLNRLLPYIGCPPKPDPKTPVLFEQELAQSVSCLSISTNEEHAVTHKKRAPSWAPQVKANDASTNSEKVLVRTSQRGLQADKTNSKSIEALGDGIGSTRDDGIAKKLLRFFPAGKISPFTMNDADPGDQALAEPGADEALHKQTQSKFCVFVLLAKFPYKYMDDPDSAVSQRFFASNKFYERTWNLFYLNPPRSLGGKSLVLVPLQEAQKLIDEISESFDINLTVPPFPFTMVFYEDGTPQPAFLGRSHDRNDINSLQQNIPYEISNTCEVPIDASEDTRKKFIVWHEKFARVQACIGTKSARKNFRGKNQHYANIQVDAQLQNCFYYLGLGPLPKTTIPTSEREQATEPEVEHVPESITAEASTTLPTSLKNNVILVCIDVESDERNHNVVTEIGVSTLDTTGLTDVPPGQDGNGWIDHICSRHFRIQGTEHIQNSRWCVGDPKSFEFGQSEWTSLADVPQIIGQYFRPAFPDTSKDVTASVSHPDEMKHSENERSCGASEQSMHMDQKLCQRDIVILGHDVRTDLAYLANLGCEVFQASAAGTANNGQRQQSGNLAGLGDINTANAHPCFLSDQHNLHTVKVIDTLDTALIDQAMRKDTQPRSLAKICQDVGITAWNLHNAGNDARYTLEAFIKLALKSWATEQECHQGALDRDRELL